MAKSIRIGIVYHPHHVEHGPTANQFSKALAVPSKENDYSPGLLPTNFNEDSLRSRMVLGEEGDFSLYVVIGVFFTKTLSDIYKEIEPIPTIFVGVENPVALGVIQSLERPGVPMSGVIITSDLPTMPADFIVNCLPQYKKVFLPHACESMDKRIYERAETIAAYLRKHGIEVITVPVKSAEETMSAAIKYVPKIDCILLLEGCLAGQVAPQLARLCFRSRKILFTATGKSGILLGAAFSYGPSFAQVIKTAVAMIHRHFDLRKALESMPVQAVPNNRILYINEAVLRLMGSSEEFIERLRKMADGKSIVMVKYWPAPPPGEEEDRPFIDKED